MATFEFARWDGSQQFRALSAEAAFDKLSEYFLEHGEYLLRQLERMDKSDDEVLQMLLKEGYLEKGEEGRISIAPRGIRRIENKAIEELFAVQKRDIPGKHATDFKGAGPARHDDNKPYEFGDPVANLNLHETFRNAIARQDRDASADRAAPGMTISLVERDFVVYETEHQASCATVVLLDMPVSMARYAKFYHAKKVALALLGLVRGRYTEDSIKVMGFYTYASTLSERALLGAGPKPVSIFDSRVFLRVSLDNPPEHVPEHFTNIHAGLKVARNHLAKLPAANKQILCITDGEPTAHLEWRDVVLMYPPNERTARATLAEAAA